MRAGMSLSSLPKDPGAPFGHKRIGGKVCAYREDESNKIAAEFGKGFMKGCWFTSQRENTRGKAEFNEEVGRPFRALSVTGEKLDSSASIRGTAVGLKFAGVPRTSF